MVVALVGGLVAQGHLALARQPQASGAPSQVLASGSRSDAQADTVTLLRPIAAQIISLGQTVGFWRNARWGDYSAVVLEPASCCTAGCIRLWFGGMVGTIRDIWTTIIGATAYTITQA